MNMYIRDGPFRSSVSGVSDHLIGSASAWNDTNRTLTGQLEADVSTHDKSIVCCAAGLAHSIGHSESRAVWSPLARNNGPRTRMSR